MILGRVILPAIGFALAGVLVWQVARTGSLELSCTPATSSFHWLQDGPPGNSTGSREGADAPTDVRPKPQTAPKIAAEGRVVAYPGAEVVVGAETPGTIVAVRVREKAIVRAGELLVEFKADELRATLDEAAARVTEAEAELDFQQKELARTERLIQRKAGTDEERERIRSRLIVARARRTAAAATYKRLEAALAKTRITAPIEGIVTLRMAHPGETVNIGTPLVKIVDLKKLRIEAEVDEYDIGRCVQGAPVTITAEGYRGKSWKGTVEETADTVTGRRIRPEDPGKPTDTRVMPVRIAFRELTPLKLGQRVEVEIAEIARKQDDSPAPERPPGASEQPAVPAASTSQ
jgi:RND family efflux transporter MFP subunit